MLLLKNWKMVVKEVQRYGLSSSGSPGEIEQPKNLVMAALLRGRRLAFQFIEDFEEIPANQQSDRTPTSSQQ